MDTKKYIRVKATQGTEYLSAPAASYNEAGLVKPTEENIKLEKDGTIGLKNVVTSVEKESIDGIDYLNVTYKDDQGVGQQLSEKIRITGATGPQGPIGPGLTEEDLVDIKNSYKQVDINKNNINLIKNVLVQDSIIAKNTSDMTEEKRQTGGDTLSSVKIIDESKAIINKIKGNTVSSKNLIPQFVNGV